MCHRAGGGEAVSPERRRERIGRQMPTPKATVTQAEVRRYLRAMREAGFDEGRVKIDRPDGVRVTIEAGKAGEAARRRRGRHRQL